jgi:hypothetical protein
MHTGICCFICCVHWSVIELYNYKQLCNLVYIHACTYYCIEFNQLRCLRYIFIVCVCARALSLEGGRVQISGNDINRSKFYSEEIKSRLKLENACSHSVQNLLSSRLLSKNLKIKIYKTIILPVVLYGCETWSLTLREERRLRMLRRVF